MIKNLISLDSTNFNNSVFTNLKFSEVTCIGGTCEIIDKLTSDEIDSINIYTQNAQKYISSLPNYDNVFTASPVTPAPKPVIGNLLNKFLSLGTSTILNKIVQKTNIMYVVVMDKNIPKICKVSSGFLKPLKIDIIYSECPAKM
jgi:hypothetical protein